MYAEELCFTPKYVRLKQLVDDGGFGYAGIRGGWAVTAGGRQYRAYQQYREDYVKTLHYFKYKRLCGGIQWVRFLVNRGLGGFVAAAEVKNQENDYCGDNHANSR